MGNAVAEGQCPILAVVKATCVHVLCLPSKYTDLGHICPNTLRITFVVCTHSSYPHSHFLSNLAH